MASNAQTAQGLALAIFGASAGGYLNFLEAKASDARALSTELAGYLKRDLGKTLSVSDILANLQLKSGTTAYTAAKAALDVQVAGGATPADAAAAAVTYLFGLSDTTSDLYATATAFKARVDVAVAWSKGAGATETTVTKLVSHQAEIDNPAPVVPVPTTTALTSAADNLTGTIAADTFTGVRSALSAEGTLGATDKIDGGEGTDTLSVDLKTDFTGFTTGSTKSVEVITLTNSGDVARSFDATGVNGAATYNLDSKTGISLSNVDTLGTVNVLNRASGTTTVDFADAKVSSTTDNVLTLGVTKLGSGASTFVTVAAPDIQKMTVVASGAASNVDLAGAPLKSLTITGSSDLSLRGTSITTLTSIDGSEATGKLTLSRLAGTVSSIKTGSASDTVTVGAITTAAVLSGGAGDDKLTLSSLAADTYQPVMTGFETLAVSSSAGDITLSLAKSTDLANLTVDALGGNLTMVKAGAAALKVSAQGAQSAATVSTDTSGAVSFATIAADTVTTVTNDTDALSLTASKASALSLDFAKYTNATGTFTAGEAKTVALNASGGFVGVISAGKATDMAITGSETVTLTGSTLSSVNNLTATEAKSLTLAGLTGAGSLSLTGTGTTSVLDTGTLGAATSTQAVSVTATGWKGGSTIGPIDSQDSIKVDVSGTTGAVTLNAIGGGNASATPTGSVTINATNALGSLTATDIDVGAGKSITVTAKDAVAAISIGSGQTLSVATSSSNPSGSITVDVSGGIAATTLGGLKAGTVNVNVSNMLKAATVGAIDSLTMTYTGDESSVGNTRSDKANNVTFTGGDGVDSLTITHQDSSAADTTNVQTHALNISTGAANDVVTFNMYAAQTKATYTGTIALGENSGDADTLTFNAGAAATLLDLQGLTVTGADAAIEIDGTAGAAGLTIYGTAVNDLITTSTGGTNTVFAGTGDDVIEVALATDLGAGSILNGGLGSDTLYLSEAAAYNLTNLSSTSDNLVGEAGIENLIVKNTAITLDEAISGTALRINTDGAVTLTMSIDMVGTKLDLSKVTYSALSSSTSTATETALTAVNDSFNITGTAGADTITLSNLGDTVDGNGGADTITDGTGVDAITIGVGASTVNFGVAGAIRATIDLTVDGTAGVDDTDTFTGVFDTVTGVNSGDTINFLTLTLASETLDGSAAVGKYQTVQGTYAAGVFTVDTATGLDTLVLWNDGTNGDNAIVLAGITTLTGVTIG